MFICVSQFRDANEKLPTFIQTKKFFHVAIESDKIH